LTRDSSLLDVSELQAEIDKNKASVALRCVALRSLIPHPNVFALKLFSEKLSQQRNARLLWIQAALKKKRSKSISPLKME
jgi:aminopeptidase C